VQQRSVTTALLVVAFVICPVPVLVAPVASWNRFPETGAFIVWAGPHAAGMPEGLRTICSGALIRERVSDDPALHRTRRPRHSAVPARRRLLMMHETADRADWWP
jgi:hypothetical protein